MKTHKLILALLLSILSASLFCQTKEVTPSVEDTIRYQLGGELHFDYKINDPQLDSITVLKTIHLRDVSQYQFIVHNKNTSFHDVYKEKHLEDRYNWYFENDTGGQYKSFFDTRIQEQKDTLNQQIYIDEKIKNYKGYWTYLARINDEFYLNQSSTWITTKHIGDSLCLDLRFMDGPFPCFITYFKEMPNGDYIMKTTLDRNPIYHTLIDKERGIYKTNEDYYCIHIKNINKFEIMMYASTEECMSFF